MSGWKCILSELYVSTATEHAQCGKSILPERRNVCEKTFSTGGLVGILVTLSTFSLRLCFFSFTMKMSCIFPPRCSFCDSIFFYCSKNLLSKLNLKLFFRLFCLLISINNWKIMYLSPKLFTRQLQGIFTFLQLEKSGSNNKIININN